MSSYPSYPAEPPRPYPWGPFTAGDIIRRIFEVYRQHAAVLIGVSFVATLVLMVPQVPGLAFQRVMLMSNQASPDPTRIFKLLPLVLLIGLVSFFVSIAGYALAGGGIFSALLSARRGEITTVSSALNQGASRFGSAYGATLLVWLRMLGWYLLVAIPAAIVLVFISAMAGFAAKGAGSAASIGLTVVLMVLCAIAILLFLIWIFARYFVTLGAMYAEGLTASAAIRRSIDLSRGNKGRIYAVFGLLFIIALALGAVFGSIAVVALVRHGFHPGAPRPMLPMRAMLIVDAAQLILTTVVYTFVILPVLAIGMSLCYFDLRARAEAVPPPPPLDPVPGIGSSPAYPPAPYVPSAAPYPGAPISETPQPGAPPAPPSPYLAGNYDSPRSFRTDPGRGVPLSEALPERVDTDRPADDDPNKEPPL